MSSTDLAPTSSEPSPPAEFLRQVANASACFPLCFLLVFYGQWGLSSLHLQLGTYRRGFEWYQYRQSYCHPNCYNYLYSNCYRCQWLFGI